MGARWGRLFTFRIDVMRGIDGTRDATIAPASMKARARATPLDTEEELTTGMPLIVDHVVETLRLSGPPSKAVSDGAPTHGHRVLRLGLSVSQVVHAYEHVHQAAAELAFERDAPITAVHANDDYYLWAWTGCALGAQSHVGPLRGGDPHGSSSQERPRLAPDRRWPDQCTVVR